MLRRLLAVLVAAPMFAVAASAQTATTVCKDGTTSATTGRGACTGHGGVDKSATKKSAAAAKAERKAASRAPAAPAAATVGAAPKPAAATVTCGDGTSSKAGRGACARHGGVKTASATPAPAAKAAAPTTAASVRPAPAARQAAPATATTHAANTDPTGATAQCKDGTYSHATNHRGACARHQGVAKWL